MGVLVEGEAAVVWVVGCCLVGLAVGRVCQVEGLDFAGREVDLAEVWVLLDLEASAEVEEQLAEAGFVVGREPEMLVELVLG